MWQNKRCQGFPALLLGHISFISGKVPLIKPCCPPPARCSPRPRSPVGQYPFARVAWSWQPHSSFPHSRGSGGAHANRKQLGGGCRVAAPAVDGHPWVMGRLECPEVPAQVGRRQPQIQALRRGSGLRFIIACWHLLAEPRTSSVHERVTRSKLLAQKYVSSFQESREMGIAGTLRCSLGHAGSA